MARRELPLIDAVKPYWQRREIVLLVLHPDCERCARSRQALLAAGGPLRGFDVAVIPLELGTRQGEPGNEQRLSLARVAGVEPEGAFVLVADRFLELFTAIDAHPRDLDDFVADVSGWVEAVQRQVCECSRMPDEPT